MHGLTLDIIKAKKTKTLIDYLNGWGVEENRVEGGRVS